MKAMILAAGFGTRLLPFTEHTPKPLFTIAGRPLLDRTIYRLSQAGFSEIIVNTHHLHRKIASFIAEQKYAIPVHVRHEPEILGTGGGIKNAEDFWNNTPLLVVNSDIVTDIDLRTVYDFHCGHAFPVTLVLHDDPEFNTVSVDEDGFIVDFNDPENTACAGKAKKLTFTGIQILNPEVLDFTPVGRFSSIIDAYRRMMSEGRKIRAYISKDSCWKDIGTPERYRAAAFEEMAPEAFRRAFPGITVGAVKQTGLSGDGSDRSWFRLTAGGRSLIMADHGIRQKRSTCEVDSFVDIGRHLYDSGLPVPRIYLYDRFSGLVFLEDLGDTDLQGRVRRAGTEEEIVTCYTSVIDLIATLSFTGARRFDLSWTYQTPRYDSQLILEKECRYFVDAFLNGYLGMKFRFEDLEDDFVDLAQSAVAFSINGFMHRDMQSRNIMIQNNTFYFIDFQGGRLGPVQYDIASLLIDPYVELPVRIKDRLLEYATEMLTSSAGIDPDRFKAGFRYCAITRNLQILGAFGFLSRVKGKTYFEEYIPGAVKTLKHAFSTFEKAEFPKLKTVVEALPEL
ncbi:MAG: sugar phosphate nucleotidyltransferase [Pseudomonadota bacterium]